MDELRPKLEEAKIGVVKRKEDIQHMEEKIKEFTLLKLMAGGLKEF